jgi:hypothetical protein
MLGVGLVSWLAVTLLPDVESGREVLFGMMAPLAAAVATWILVVRVYAIRPEWLTPVMILAFGAKLVFFGVYVALMLKVLQLNPMPFVVSFTSYFIGLHFFEALCLQRFFASGIRE